LIEKEFSYSISDKKTIEKIIEDDNVGINHIILPKGEKIPEHYSNSNVYMIIISGTIALRLGDQQEHVYEKGSIITIPFETKMNGRNKDDELLEFFVVKAPSPKMMGK
jgi:quercetin dioxygenase-like cupin family protein